MSGPWLLPSATFGLAILGGWCWGKGGFPKYRTSSLEKVLRVWGAQDPAEAWRAMASLPVRGEARTACFKGLCAAVVEKDPDLFLRLPPAPPEHEQPYQSARHRALRQLAASRPELALEHIHQAPEFRKQDLDAVAALWAKTRPEAALAWSEGSGWKSAEKELFQRAAIAAWAETDAEAAARFLLTRPALMRGGSREDPDPRTAVTARLAAVDMRRSMAWLAENVAPEEQGLYVRSLREVLPHDLTRWLPDFFASVPEGPHRGALLREVLAGRPGYPRFAGLDILQKLQALPGSSGPDWLPVFKTIAAEYADDPTSNFRGVVRNFASLEGPARAAVALELSRNPSIPMDSTLLVTALTADPGFLSPTDLSGILKSSLPTGLAVLEKLGYRENCYTEAATLQAAQNAPATAEWVLGLGDERARREAAAGLVTAWCLSDELAASEWTAALPPGALRDEAAASLAGHLAATAPSDAWEWTMSIPDASARRELLRRIAASWLESDKEAARTAIVASPLPQPLRDELLSPKPDHESLP